MKVSDAIKYLKKCPPEAQIFMSNEPGEYLQLTNITSVSRDGISMVALADSRYDLGEEFTVL